MPAIASLIPRFSKARERDSKAPWILNIPPHLSETGKEQRRFFPTRKAAALTALQLQNRQDNFGISLVALTPVRIAEASEAFNLLEGTDLRLLDAVRTGLELYRTRTTSIPFLELFNGYIDTLEGRRHVDYVRAYRQ